MLAEMCILQTYLRAACNASYIWSEIFCAPPPIRGKRAPAPATMAPSTFAPAGDGGAAAGRGGPLEEECSYIFVSLEGVTDRGTPYGEIGIDGLLGDQPTVVLRDGRTLTGAFDEDAGSTMYFCRQALKRAGDAHNRESNGLIVAADDSVAAGNQAPLVAITSKRLRLC